MMIPLLIRGSTLYLMRLQTFTVQPEVRFSRTRFLRELGFSLAALPHQT